MDRIADKVFLVTGASAGIGAALGRELAHRKAKVALLARRGDRLEQLAEELRRGGAQALPIACDVTRADEVRQAVARAVSHFGQIDGVIANAGIGVGGWTTKLTVDDYRRQMETNVFGVLHTVYAT